MKYALKFTGYLLALLLALWCLNIAVAGQGTYVPRFHRYALTPIDMSSEVKGVVDMVKDAASGKCYAVYVLIGNVGWQALATTSLGEVPCNPAPVPPKRGDAPPASPVR